MYRTINAKTALTQAQISLYWRRFAQACSSLGLTSKEEREQYRLAVMVETTGKKSLRDLNRTNDFDAVLRRFSADSGDYQMAAAASIQDEKRIGYLIKVVCIQLMQLKGGDVASARDYLGGILEQARIPNGRNLDDDSYWLDLTFSQAHKVFMMLDTHRRRLLRPWAKFAAFSPGVRYEIQKQLLIRQEVPRDYYTNIPFTINWVREVR